MSKYLLTILCCLLTLPAVADERGDAMGRLFEAFEVREGGIDSLLKLRYAVTDALIDSAIEKIEAGDLPQFGKGEGLIIEFSDYQCGYCRRMFPLVLDAADSGAARVVLIEFPILGPLSETASRYALAAHEQGRYAEFHRRLMSGGRPTEENVISTAEEVGLDMDKVNAYIDSPEATEAINNNYQLAALFGFRATPTFIINGQIFRGALSDEDFRKVLSGN